MAKILVAYDTTEDQTRKIGQYMGDSVSRSGHDAQVIDIRRPSTGFSSDGCDAIIVGASIYFGRHFRHLSELVRRHKACLAAVPSGFFSVSLSAGVEKQKAEAIQYLGAFLEKVEWSPTIETTLAGGLLYLEYRFLKRWMMKRIAKDAGKDTDTSKNHEYTDWEVVDQFMTAFLVQLNQRPSGGT